jgi:hypothetical protein
LRSTRGFVCRRCEDIALPLVLRGQWSRSGRSSEAVYCRLYAEKVSYFGNEHFTFESHNIVVFDSDCVLLDGDICVSPAQPQLYPGTTATKEQVLRLAEEYRKAAKFLQDLAQPGDPISRSPFRLSAIHAIELYLNALLMSGKHDQPCIRGMQHNLAARSKLAVAEGLRLRKRTMAHLESMTGNREYLVTRYGPEMTATVSQVNRLTATLDEVAEKVSAIVGKAG